MKRKHVINKIPKIHLACSKDLLRPVMTCVYVSNGVASATDAHMLAQMDLRTESTLQEDDIKNLEGKLIPSNAWKEMVNADFVKVERDGILLHKKDMKYKMYFNDEKDLKFPNIEDVKKSLVDKKRGAKSDISLNPTFLKLACEILETHSININFYNGENSAFICYEYETRKAYVMVMPVMKDGVNYDIMLF